MSDDRRTDLIPLAESALRPPAAAAALEPAGPAAAVVVRPLELGDVDRVAALHRHLTGEGSSERLRARIERAASESGVSLSLVAERDGMLLGYLLASLDALSYGALEPIGAVEAIGVRPDQRGRRLGTRLLARLGAQLRALKVDRVRTEADWREGELLQLLCRTGFAVAPRICLEAEVEALPAE